jgi:hypothetical protein
MTKLKRENPNSRELCTEVLDKSAWWSTLKVIVRFLQAKDVDEVRVESRFVTNRGPQTRPHSSGKVVVPLPDLEIFIANGLDEGTIEWLRTDFCFYPVGIDVGFMLCNDADLHFVSTDSALLRELVRDISEAGIRVHNADGLI